jgi:glycosidase
MIGTAVPFTRLVAALFSCSLHSYQGHQLVTDRFALADGSGPTCNTEDRKYCGGTYQGVINHLDYIQNMGFDAVWISPVVANFEGSGAYGEAYHGLVDPPLS